MLKTLDNKFALGDDKYPDALEVLAVYERRNLVPTPNKKTTPQDDDAMADPSFVQITKDCVTSAAKNGRIATNVKEVRMDRAIPCLRAECL